MNPEDGYAANFARKMSNPYMDSSRFASVNVG